MSAVEFTGAESPRQASLRRFADNLDDDGRPRAQYGSFRVYATGSARLHRATGYSKMPRSGVTAKRGAIKTLSKHSLGRLKAVLATYSPRPGFGCVGFTYTIPGPVWPMDDYRAFWARHCENIQDRGWGLIWRVEVQERGALHWHGIGICPDGLDGVDTGAMAREAVADHVAWGNWSSTWHNALDGLGPREFDPPFQSGGRKRPFRRVESLMHLPGALGHASRVRPGARDCGMRRYMCKIDMSKSSQVAHDIGRHWGIVGRSRWQQEAAVYHCEHMTPLHELLLTRIEQRWARFRIPRLSTVEGNVWKTCLSHKSRYGRGHGTFTWFRGNPGMQIKACEFTRQESQEREHDHSMWD